MAQDRFDLKVVLENFEQSIIDSDDISTDLYLKGYTELNKYIHNIDLLKYKI